MTLNATLANMPITGKSPPNTLYVVLKPKEFPTYEPPMKPVIRPTPLTASNIPTMNSVSFGYLFAANEKQDVLIVAEAAPWTALKNSEHEMITD